MAKRTAELPRCRRRVGGMVAVMLAVALAACGSSNASDDESDGGEPEAGRLLYIGPHPDDEYYAAPLFGHLCRDSGWSCTLVVATRGENGSCGLPGGCSPDLPTVRSAEMEKSAQLLGAELIHWDLGDNGSYQPYPGDVEDVLALWAERAGSGEALLEQVRGVIRDVDPSVVYTMDPRHGNYCHPTHRAVGALVAQAILDLGEQAPQTRLLSAAWFEEPAGFGFRPVAPADPSLAFFDATTASELLAAESWLYTLRVLQLHASQFDVASVADEAFASATQEHKRVWWVPMEGAADHSPLYDGVCAPSTF